MPTDAVLVLTTLGADADAHAFATRLVEERLAACVNILPEMRSTYRWQGAVESAVERQVIIKTTAGRLEALRHRVQALHAYEVPEFLVLPVGGGSDAYLAWVRASV